jgi:hypothetical protein
MFKALNPPIPASYPRRREDHMFIARLKARLVTGETVELLPVKHETDVKKE